MKELNLLMVTLILQGHKKCSANNQPSHMFTLTVFSLLIDKKNKPLPFIHNILATFYLT